MGRKFMRTASKLAAGLLTAVMCLNVFGGTYIKNPSEVTVSAASSTVIQNNTFWKDTSGNNIYSQGGGIFKFGDTYYWYGVHYNGADTYAASPSKKNDDTGFKSVTCYSSKDLVNWKFENDVLTGSSKNFPWCYWFGRLGVCYNAKTKKYVLIAQHNESVLFASCSTPTGNFTVENVQEQIPGVLKAGTGDQTVFIDDDGTPYIICSNKGGRGHQYVVPLRASDYLAAEQAVEVAKGSGREGNCMFKYKGKYYFCASDLHGWNASHSYVMWSDKITGPYNSWSVMDGTDADFSHVTQTGFFVTVKGNKQETVLFCGDRWSDFAGNGIGYNQWCPLSFNGDKPFFNSLSQWDFNAQTGEWKVGSGNNYILNPSFDADRVSQEKLAGWTNSGTGNSNSSGARTGRWCMQQWSDSAFKGTMSQNITLPNNTYTLKAWAKSSGGQNSSKIYVSGYGGDEKNVSIKDIGGNWKEITIPDIKVTNGKCQVGISSDGKAGNWVKVDDFTLIGNGTLAAAEPTTEPTTVPVTEPSTVPVIEPIPDGTYIKSLKVMDSANAADWSIQKEIKKGDKIFGDRDFNIVDLPENLSGAEYIRTACDSKKFTDKEAEFTVGENITVYIGIDSRVTPLPSWLEDWKLTKESITDNGEPIVTYNIYKKDYNKNDKVELGKLGMANAVNYIVMAKPTETGKPDIEPDKPEKPMVKGDLNNDGKIDVFDAVLMRRNAVKGWHSDNDREDVNSDKAKDGKDVKELQHFIVRKIHKFTEGQSSVETPSETTSKVPPATEVTSSQTTIITTTEHKLPEEPTVNENGRLMEYLDRGVTAVSTGKGAFISWRYLADDPENAAFNVYRTTDGKSVKLNDKPVTGGTNYTDSAADLTKNNTYSVKMVLNGTEKETDGNYTLAANSTAQCITVPIKEGGTIHFVWAGDFNGDGKYDYLVDRCADDHQKLEAYLNDGTYLYTIDLGVNSENKNNISPGSSAIDVGMWDGATVYDIDCDGYAEILLRVGDGVTMGDGKKYTNSVTNGQEIAVIDGKTGALKAAAPVPDDYIKVGPMACMMEVGYLNGRTPSVVCWMKNRNSDKTFNSLTVAYGYENGKFVQQWKYDNKIMFDDRHEYKNGYAEAHQIRVVDVDSDGKDEVLHQGYALNGDGTLRYHMDEIVHGDRWFVGAFSNNDNGGEMMGYGIQQENQSGLLEYFYNASTGKILWKNQTTDGSTYDVGRGNVGDVDPDHDGFECFSFQGTWTNDGKKICDEYLYPCIRLWWDGDLLSEQYNDTKFEKWNVKNKSADRLLSPWKITDCRGSERGAPMFYGDIMGDWREEVIMTSTDFSKLVIFTTTAPTDERIYCLAQNPCYRNCMTGKGYYQSHMLDFYLGTGMDKVTVPNISIIKKE